MIPTMRDKITKCDEVCFFGFMDLLEKRLDGVRRAFLAASRARWTFPRLN